MIKKLSAIALMLAFPALAQASTNLLQNGSFEDYVVDSGHWSTFFTTNGWNTSKKTGVEVRYDVAGTAEDGNKFAELDTNQNSWISQTVLTAPGEALTLSFWYAPREGVSTGSNKIAVFWNGEKLTVVKGNGYSNTGWIHYTATVYADGDGSSVLKFAARGDSDSYGGSLDNVSLTAAVPEPETYAMLLAGLGLVGAVARRRKSKQA